MQALTSLPLYQEPKVKACHTILAYYIECIVPYRVKSRTDCYYVCTLGKLLTVFFNNNDTTILNKFTSYIRFKFVGIVCDFIMCIKQLQTIFFNNDDTIVLNKFTCKYVLTYRNSYIDR